MKTAIKTSEGTWKIVEVEMPQIASDQVLIRVKRSGICGGDLHHWRKPVQKWKNKSVTMAFRGHEFSGDVVEIGEDVTNVVVGDRVAFEPLIGCGKCPYCLTGEYNLCPDLLTLKLPFLTGFSEYAKAPSFTLYKLPENVSYEEAALLDCLSVAVHAIHRAKVKTGDTVAIVGMGTIGLSTLIMARKAGAKVIAIDLYDSPLKVAEKLGAFKVINSHREDPVKEVKEATDYGYGVDVVFEAIGGNTDIVPQCLDMARYGGVVALIGIFEKPLEEGIISKVQRLEKDLIGVYNYSIWDNKREFQIALDYIARGEIDVKPLITHRFPLDKINEAFDVAKNKKETGAIKVMLIP